MNEELQPLETRENSEEAMLATDEAATFEPFEVPAEGDVPDLSDDDIAAALGYATTISEPFLEQQQMAEEGEMMPEEEETTEEPQESETEEPEEDVDTEQTKEIEEIRAELEKLQEEVYGEKTEDTEPTGQA